MSYDWMPDDEEFDEVLHRRAEELHEIPDTLPDEDGLILCPVLPLREIVIFPRMMSPLFLNREASLLAVEEAHSIGGLVVTRLRNIPKEGDTIEEQGYKITVIEADRRAVIKVKMERL